MALKYVGNAGFGFDANLIECFEYRHRDEKARG